MPRGAPDYLGAIRDLGVETRYFERYGDFEALGTEEICDYPNIDVELLHMEIASSSNVIFPIIEPYKVDGELDTRLWLHRKDGVGRLNPSPLQIHAQESILWLELVYDTSGADFKFGLGYPLRFANGVKIQLETTAAVTIKVASSVIILLRS